MKICNKCKIDKELDEFNKNKRKKDGYQDYCKPCKSKSDKKYYLKDPTSYNNRNVEYYKEKCKKLEYIFNNKKCNKCNEDRYWLIDFHHIDPKQKEFNIGSGKRDYKINKIKAEIEKCVPLCSNCHRDFHHKERQDNITIKEYLKML